MLIASPFFTSMTKACTKCKIVKELANFHKNNSNKDKHQNICKECIKLSIDKNKEKLRIEKYRKSGTLQKSQEQYRHTDRYKKTMQKYYSSEEYKAKSKERRSKTENKEKLKIYRSTEEFKAKRREQRKCPIRRAKERTYESNRYKNDINFRLRKNLRARLKEALNGRRKSLSTIVLLGCSIEELKIHLEKQFKDGMSWENYGDWHIDHILPLSKFDLTDEKYLKQICHYTNLQPLWAIDNLIKSNKL